MRSRRAATLVVTIALSACRQRPPRDLVVRDVPAAVDAERVLFSTRHGRVVARPLAGEAGALHLHRDAHEVWVPLASAEVVRSSEGRWARTTLVAGQLLDAPPYALVGWTRAEGALLAFVGGPEDGPVPVTPADARLADATDATAAELSGPTAAWMRQRLRRVAVPTVATLGPFEDDVAIYVAAGSGSVRTDAARSIGARQLLWLRGRTALAVQASAPLLLLVFEPERSEVTAILKTGQKRYSQDDEELVIRDFFHDRREGRFVDVGAGHYQRYSTTYYLEEQLGWSGVAVDALAEYADGYRQHRPRTTFVNALVTDRARGEQPFYRAERFPELSSVSRALAEAQARELADGGAIVERRVPSRTLDDVLDRLGVRAFELLSMDIEEHEPQALAGFDIERFRPALVCVEAHPAVADALWSYFRRHGYARQEQYLPWDQANWYFAPIAP